MTEVKKKAKAKYKKKVKRITIDFYPTENELWNKIQAQDNKQGFIKKLIENAPI